MEEEILNRLQSLEFSSLQLSDYLLANTANTKTDYLIENNLINSKRRQLYELNEAFINGL